MNTQPNPETRFDRGAWLVLLFALVFIALDIAQLAYRFTLPTDGWIIRDLGPNTRDFLMHQNAVGAPSPLQPGDAVHIIGGVPSTQILLSGNLTAPRPTGWEVGGRVPVTVIRNGQLLTFDIPIVHWTFAAWWRNNLTDFNLMMNWLAALILLSVGLFTFIKRPHNLAARFLFLFGLTDFAITLSSSLPDPLGLYFNLNATLIKVLFSNVIFAYMLGPSLLSFALTFPRPKAFIQQRPWRLVAPYLVGAITPILLFTAPPLALIGYPLTLAMILSTIAALIHSGFTMRDAISRAQLRWAIGGVVAGLALFTLNYWLGFPLPHLLSDVLLAVASLGFPLMGISLAVAILRYRLFDIDLIIRRTLQYSVLSALLALVYFGGVVLLQRIFTALTGQGQNQLVTVLSTLAIAALFTPLRRRVQDGIDQRFYLKKYDAAKTLAAFAATVRDETDLDKLAASLIAVVQETMQPAHVSLWLKPTETRPDRFSKPVRPDGGQLDGGDR